MRTKEFWLSALERMLKTFCQALVVVWPVGDAALGLYDVDWKKALITAGLAAAASLMTSVLSAPVGPDGSPSLVGEPPKEPAEVTQADIADAHVHDDEPGRHAWDGDEGEIPVMNFNPPPPRASRYRRSR
jgi:hypothetical protein